ncbi:MAG: hypothetical protein AAFY38_10375 [Pseudomonadota bacterium]
MFGSKPKAKKKQKSTFKKDMKDVGTGVAKELPLVGLYGVQELTGADMHTKPKKAKQPWQKKWGER